jgi:hypothetical protein
MVQLLLLLSSGNETIQWKGCKLYGFDEPPGLSAATVVHLSKCCRTPNEACIIAEIGSWLNPTCLIGSL